MAESEPVVQTTSQEELTVTSSDQTDNDHGEKTITFSTFGFDIKTQKTDLALIFGKHRLYVRRSFLEDASPVLEGLFEEKLAGKTDQEVAIEDVSCEDFAEFLACIQRSGRRKITKENVYRMLEIANKYDVEDAKERCEDCLLGILDEEKQNPMPVLRIFHLASENNLPSLKSMCMERADWKILDAVQEKDKDFTISSKLFVELVGQFLPGLLSKSYLLDFLNTSSSSGNVAKMWDFDNAKGFKTRFNISTQTYKQTFKLWDVSWDLEVGLAGNIPIHPWYIGLKENQKMNSTETVKIGIACKFFNYMYNKEDCSAFRTFTFQEIKNGISWNSTYDMDIKESELQHQNLGFSYGGKYDIEVYVLMNKPESVNT